MLIRKRHLIRIAKLGNLREIHRVPHDAYISHIDSPRHQRCGLIHIDLAFDGNRAGRIQSQGRRHQGVCLVFVIKGKYPQLIRCRLENIDDSRIIARIVGIKFHLFEIILSRRRNGQTPCIDDTGIRHDHALRAHKQKMPTDGVLPQRIDCTGDINLILNKVHEVRRFCPLRIFFEVHIRRIFLCNGKIGESVDPKIPLHLLRIHIGDAIFKIHLRPVYAGDKTCCGRRG